MQRDLARHGGLRTAPRGRRAQVCLGSADVPPAAPVGACFPTWQAFTESGLDADGFYLCDGSTDVPTIRRSLWWDRPVHAAAGLPLGPGADGNASWAEALRAAERAGALRESLQIDTQALQYDEKLLYFLYLREPGELVPQLDRHKAQLYHYPVAEMLAESGLDVQAWLTSLTRRGLLEPVRLVDRTRHCASCGSAHQHFLDVCPHCGGMHIHKGHSLHCFSCGHVGPEADFMGDHGMRCPQCSARLRHIGVDYDRPLTQYLCGGCHHAFVEATVHARCLDCGTGADPGQLAVHEVATLRLSLRGRAMLRAGQISDAYAALEGVGFAPVDQFKGVVDWALTTQRRHPEFQFALILIELANVAELVEAHGAQQAYAMLDEFARRLRELLRTSDVATRTSEERLWLFLPYCSAEGFRARLTRSVAAMEATQGARIEVHSEAVAAPKDIAQGERIDALMARVQARVQMQVLARLRSREPVLAA